MPGRPEAKNISCDPFNCWARWARWDQLTAKAEPDFDTSPRALAAFGFFPWTKPCFIGECDMIATLFAKDRSHPYTNSNDIDMLTFIMLQRSMMLTGMTTKIRPFLISPSLLRLLLWLGTCPLIDHRLLEETSLVGWDHTWNICETAKP